MDQRVVKLEKGADVVEARRVGREMAALAGLGSADQTRFATAISELTRNVIQYAGKGQCFLAVIKNHASAGVRAVVKDNGPGIADIEKAMTQGYSTSSRIGAGLPGAKKLVSYFEIKSKPGNTEIVVELIRRLPVMA